MSDDTDEPGLSMATAGAQQGISMSTASAQH